MSEVYVYNIKDCSEEQDQSSGSETEVEAEDMETTPDKTNPDKTSGNGRILRTVGAVGAFVGGMLL